MLLWPNRLVFESCRQGIWDPRSPHLSRKCDLAQPLSGEVGHGLLAVPFSRGNGVKAHRTSEGSPDFVSRWVCLAVGIIWSTLAMLVVLNLHVDPDNQRNIDGQLVMHTLYGRDSGLWLANFFGIGLAIFGVAVELAIRARTRSPRPGIVALALGTLLCLYSLFGLLYGIIAIAPIGILIIVSGTPVTRKRSSSTASLNPRTGDRGHG